MPPSHTRNTGQADTSTPTTVGFSHADQARQILADRLGELRRSAELTGRDIARICGWHPSKSSRIEAALTTPSAADIRAWCRACAADSQADDLIATLRAVEGMFIEWQRMERTGLRQSQDARHDLYQRTRRFHAYSSWLVPGLLQTRAYTTHVLSAIQQRRGLTDDVTAAVASRLDRQQILVEGDHRFAFLLEESVLRSGMGGPDVMAGQLGHLITMASLPNISLGIVPMHPNRTRWPTEGFWIYDSTQVNVELISGYLTITQPREIALYARAFEELSTLAAYGSPARALITNAIHALA